MSDTLIACACGSTDMKVQDASWDDPMWDVICLECNVMAFGITRDEAVDNWNSFQTMQCQSAVAEETGRCAGIAAKLFLGTQSEGAIKEWVYEENIEEAIMKDKNDE